MWLRRPEQADRLRRGGRSGRLPLFSLGCIVGQSAARQLAKAKVTIGDLKVNIAQLKHYAVENVQISAAMASRHARINQLMEENARLARTNELLARGAEEQLVARELQDQVMALTLRLSARISEVNHLTDLLRRVGIKLEPGTLGDKEVVSRAPRSVLVEAINSEVEAHISVE